MTEPASNPPFMFRLSEPQSKNLLVVSKGPGAVEIGREGEKWDLLEIYFAPTQIREIIEKPSLSEANHVVFESDRAWRKFRVMKKVFETTNLLNAYDYVMFADDDLIPTECAVSDIFDLFATTGCRVGQPALTQDSYFYWFTTLKNNNFIWRKTNFAEVMCPILNKSALRDYLPYFDANTTNFGLDFFWGYHEWASGLGVAVLDDTPVKHCRPVGGGTALDGISAPHDEFVQFMKKNGIPFYSHLCLGGVANPKLSEAQINECFRLGLAVSGYNQKLVNDPKFYASYVKREIAALHEKHPQFTQSIAKR